MRTRRMTLSELCLVVLALAMWGCAASASAAASAADRLPTADGFRGIWYPMGPSAESGGVKRFKYSGGMATYPHQMLPFAVYRKEVEKTFFCYGGTEPGKEELLHMVSCYDHKTGKLARPVVLLNKKTEDAHDNPTMTMDDRGYIWIFSNSHGQSRPSYIHRSSAPYAFDSFEPVLTTNFSYGQPWFMKGQGFLFLHTRYGKDGVRNLYCMTSPDGYKWDEPLQLTGKWGHYQISQPNGQTIGTIYDYHPKGVDHRTNLYYMESADFGKTWRTVDGKALTLPLSDSHDASLVHDYEADGLMVYIKDLQYDAAGRPVILYITSKGATAVPENGPRVWRTARWTGSEWEIRRVTTSDHNYDHGSLYIEEDGTWRIIAPTDPGPQDYDTGGEMVLWVSKDEGATWKRIRSVTSGSRFNHTYARRPVDANPEFYAIWADGDARQPSESSLYFTDREGSHVWRMPGKMKGDWAWPEPVE